jgi:MFS family permease
MVVLLLFQKYFTEGMWVLRPGPAGIAEVLAVGAIGVFSGAVVTAPVVRRLGRTRWLVMLLSLVAVIVLVVGSRFTIWSTLVTTFAVGFAYQSCKVCMDSVVQADSDDAFVGRVFALYDTANNLSYVLAFCLGVFIVPARGNGVGATALVAVVFLITGWGYGWAMSRLMRRPGRPVTVIAHSAGPAGPGRGPGDDESDAAAGAVAELRSDISAVSPTDRPRG